MPVQVSTSQYVRLLSTYLRPQGRRAVLLAGLLFGSIALQLISPQILARFIDDALAGKSLASLFVLAGLFLAVALIGQGVSIAEVWVAENVGWTATNNLRNDLALHVLRLDSSFLNIYTPGALIERVDGDIGKLANFFARFIVQVLGNGLLGIGVIALMYGIDWRVGTAMTVFAIVSIAIMAGLRGFATPLWEREREASSRVFGFIEERLAGTEDIRSAGATGYVMRSNYLLVRDFVRKFSRAILVGVATSNLSIVLLAAGTALSLGLGAWLYQNDAITIGTMYLIYQYANILSQPIEQITRQMQDLQVAGASVGRIQQLMDVESAIHDGPGVAASHSHGRVEHRALGIEFDDVSFGYSDDLTLRNVSFQLAPGSVLGLIGRTGSGKTTITRLLLRLHDPTSGAVRIGGQDLRDFRLADLRARIGVVTQDIQLFNASVRDNLTFFDPVVDNTRIEAILRDLGLGTWLDSLPEGLDTLLPASGGGLSAGEAQLLAFARVFLHDPQIVILDEASSRLDPASELRLERAVDRLLAGRTGIVIAHRLATVRRAGQIMVLADGQIIEHGPRAALVDDPGSRFSRMLRTATDQDPIMVDDEPAKVIS